MDKNKSSEMLNKIKNLEELIEEKDSLKSTLVEKDTSENIA